MKSPKQPTFFDEFPLRLLFFRFRFEPHPTPFFATFLWCFFCFFSESLLTSEVKTDENLGVFLVFLLMLMRRPGGSPKKQGGEAYVGLLMSQVPPFFFGRDPAMKKHLSTQNSKCSSFLIEKR